jgi:DNA (cytosine-5)-methyltransferase 1
VSLADVTEHALLPTPTVGNATGGNAQRGGDRGNEKLLPGLAREHATDWGPYTDAIRRWEQVIGRPAPAPVRFDGKGGKPRLNPELTEWMMGWPAGWVTDPRIGLSRAEQLKACGNGVVTLQAVAALNDLLARPGVPPI